MPESLALVLAENATARLQADIIDEEDLPIPSLELGALTVTLYLRSDPRVIINSRNEQSVFNVNGGTFGETDGRFVWIMDPEDNAIVGRTRATRIEDHIALFEWTYGVGKQGNQEFVIRVEARHHVP